MPIVLSVFTDWNMHKLTGLKTMEVVKRVEGVLIDIEPTLEPIAISLVKL